MTEDTELVQRLEHLRQQLTALITEFEGHLQRKQARLEQAIRTMPPRWTPATQETPCPDDVANPSA